MPVEALAAATGTATMEITVSKSELLRELTATQGVVERKTTIPILSNYLFEASGDKLSLTATDLDLSLRTVCNAKVKKEGSCTIPARKLHDYVKLLPDADITIKLLENHWISIGCSKDSCPGVAGNDCQDWIRHRQRRIALHTERRPDGPEARIDYHGRDRRTSSGTHRTQRRKI
jgi:hypothetical protein